MRKAFIISLSAHFALMLSLWTTCSKEIRYIDIPQVYQVQLIAMPEMTPAPPEATAPEVQAETIPPTPEQKKKLRPKQKEAETTGAETSQAKADQQGQSSQALSGVHSDEQFEYPWYLRLMVDKISRNWRNPYNEKAEVTVYFRVTRDGTVTEARVEQSSGVPSFDRAALRAVVNSSPLVQLPPDFTDAQLTVHIDFVFNPM